MTAPNSDNARLARLCLDALGSFHCELERREKLVIRSIVKYSLELDLEWAVFGSSDQIALDADIHKTHISPALSSLKRMRIIQWEGADLRGFRRPMRYRVLVDELLRFARPPARDNPVVAKARAANAIWLVHVNRLYPLQPELLPSDPNEFAEALAELSRTSALAVDPQQNGEPKSGQVAREAYPPEPAARPGSAYPSEPSEDRPSSNLTPPPGGWMDPADVSRLMAESFATAGHPHPASAGTNPPGFDAGELAHALKTPLVADSATETGKGIPVADSATTRARASDHLITDGEINLSIRHPDEGMQGEPVAESATGIVPPLAIEAAMLLAKYGVEWIPPTVAQKVFEELLRCMGGAMANYGGWWWPKCRDPRTRQDVLEAIATWRLTSIHPNHKPWRGGAWRDEFHRRQRARLKAENGEPPPP